MRTKQKTLTSLKKEAVNKQEVYFATDPDREGEAIGWNIRPFLGEDKKIYRVTFQEITKSAVLKAFEHPREFDVKKIQSQMARRVLDRIVGYMISPLLWKKVGSRLSAGRVQSVALRLIVDRERAIKNFIPQEYWQITGEFQKQGRSDVLTAQLEKIDGEKFELKDKLAAESVINEIKAQSSSISDVIEKDVKRNPAPPFITSTLQQEAFNKLGFNANRTMKVAQELYEGIELGEGDPVGLITYMRTDSVNISEEALKTAREFIKSAYGLTYLPESPNRFKSKKSAQEAHEAIRPADVLKKPEDLKDFLDEDQQKLYGLIWRRFMSSQMMPAIFRNKRIEIVAGRFLFAASGSTLAFDGFMVLDPPEDDVGRVDLSPYQKGDSLNLLGIKPTQHFTKPPPRFSEATLVKTLEEDGIGRPSTYASIISTIVTRNYVLRERGYFTATELGMKICDLLVEYFPKIMDIGFTAAMEERLDLIEDGELEYARLLQDFYGPFKDELDHAMAHIEKTHEYIDEKCPECGRQMAVKWGRRGKFLSCSGFPLCKFAKPITTGIQCPQENCGGELVRRRGKSGRAFFGCSKYPHCTYTANALPSVPPPSPE